MGAVSDAVRCHIGRPNSAWSWGEGVAATSAGHNGGVKPFSRRFPTPALWAAWLAVLCQALMPVAHAQLMARSGDHPLAIFACGAGSAAFIDGLADLLPPELLAAQRGDGAQAQSGGAYDCPACAGVASGTGLAPCMAEPPFGSLHQPAGIVQARPACLSSAAALRPPARAPPV